MPKDSPAQRRSAIDPAVAELLETMDQKQVSVPCHAMTVYEGFGNAKKTEHGTA
jgi:hypothetical protein